MTASQQPWHLSDLAKQKSRKGIWFELSWRWKRISPYGTAKRSTVQINVEDVYPLLRKLREFPQRGLWLDILVREQSTGRTYLLSEHELCERQELVNSLWRFNLNNLKNGGHIHMARKHHPLTVYHYPFPMHRVLEVHLYDEEHDIEPLFVFDFQFDVDNLGFLGLPKRCLEIKWYNT